MKTLRSLLNSSPSSAWPTLTHRQRAAAMMFAGVDERRAFAYAPIDWSDLPPEVKGALLRSWNMGVIGGTTRRRKGGTTTRIRRVPVLTNSSAKPKPLVFPGEQIVWRGKNVDGKAAMILKTREGYFRLREWDNRHGWGDRSYKTREEAAAHLKNPGRSRANPVDGWAVTRDGEMLKTFGDGPNSGFDAAKWLHRRQSQSIAWAVMHEGWDIVRVKDGKVVYSYKRDLRGSKEGSLLNGTKGAYPFADKEKQYRQYTWEQLFFAKRDAARAAKAMRGHDNAAEAWYLDDLHTIASEIRRRQMARRNPGRRTRKNDVPFWATSEPTFEKMFGVTMKQWQRLFRALPEWKKREFHRRVGKSFSAKAVEWVVAQSKRQG